MPPDPITVRAVMEFLVEKSANDLPPTGLADIFDRMIWALGDNGAGVLDTAQKWLEEGSDLVRVRVALAKDEVFLYQDRLSMLVTFQNLSESFPEVSDRCREIIRRWDEQFGTDQSTPAG